MSLKKNKTKPKHPTNQTPPLNQTKPRKQQKTANQLTNQNPNPNQPKNPNQQNEQGSCRLLPISCPGQSQFFQACQGYSYIHEEFSDFLRLPDLTFLPLSHKPLLLLPRDNIM